ncbi:Nucleoside 5-triphosphatase RdgB (dHAPTP, dITP, XTP-specific) [hydrothermal vent metagenome]|uniref:dITP/XTP pyrophosphatase n=1 Tax=hydrothermal vent metagenome TaxID=652676 RepID=A0A3B1BFW7_9ZZZZ
MKVLLATSNQGKLREFNHAFENSGISFIALADIENPPEVEETGDTYEENALLKAHALAKHTGMPVVGEDSGIEIDAMPGELGVKSARFAGGRDYKEVNDIILERLKDSANRACRYVCAIAYVDPESGREEVFRKTCEGTIYDRQVGENGFGYDPIFYVPEYEKTMAELPIGVKSLISHRALAIVKLKSILDVR